MRSVSSRRGRDLAMALTLGFGMVVVTAPLAWATPGHSGGGYPGETVAPKTNPAGQSKGDEPGRGAGGTEHDEGGHHDTDRAIDDGHACGKSTSSSAVATGSSVSEVSGNPEAAAPTAVGATSTQAEATSTPPAAPPAPVSGTSSAPSLAAPGPAEVLGESLTRAPAATAGSASAGDAAHAAASNHASEGSLAFTGLDAAAAGGAALVLLATGSALVIADRRRITRHRIT